MRLRQSKSSLNRVAPGKRTRRAAKCTQGRPPRSGPIPRGVLPRPSPHAPSSRSSGFSGLGAGPTASLVRRWTRLGVRSVEDRSGLGGGLECSDLNPLAKWVEGGASPLPVRASNAAFGLSTARAPARFSFFPGGLRPHPLPGAAAAARAQGTPLPPHTGGQISQVTWGLP